MKIQEKLKNKNFRNNQNYIIDYKKKKKVIDYAYTYRKENNAYRIKNIYNNKGLKNRLKVNEFGYIKDGFFLKYNLFHLMIFLGLLFNIFIIVIKIYNGNIEIIDIVSILAALLMLYIPIILVEYFKNKGLLKKHIIFKEKFNDNKIYLYRFRK